jgi:hypothetical protein
LWWIDSITILIVATPWNDMKQAQAVSACAALITSMKRRAVAAH